MRRCGLNNEFCDCLMNTPYPGQNGDWEDTAVLCRFQRRFGWQQYLSSYGEGAMPGLRYQGQRRWNEQCPETVPGQRRWTACNGRSVPDINGKVFGDDLYIATVFISSLPKTSTVGVFHLKDSQALNCAWLSRCWDKRPYGNRLNTCSKRGRLPCYWTYIRWFS